MLLSGATVYCSTRGSSCPIGHLIILGVSSFALVSQVGETYYQPNLRLS
jgi:hypothetical protein